jgi:hypothetical protein
MLSELANARAEQPTDAAMVLEQSRGQDSTGRSFSAQYDGKEIGITQLLDPIVDDALLRGLVIPAVRGRGMVGERVVSGHGPLGRGAPG